MANAKRDVAAAAMAAETAVAAPQTKKASPNSTRRRNASDASDDDDNDSDDDAPYRGNDNNNDSDTDDDSKYMYRLHDVVEQGDIATLRSLLPLKHRRFTASATSDADSARVTRRSTQQLLATESLLLEKDDMGCLPIHVAILHQQRECALHLLAYSPALTAAMLRLKCGDLGTPIVHLILRVGALNAAFATALILELYDASSKDAKTLAANWSDDMQALLLERLSAKDDEGNSVAHLCAINDLATCLTTLAAFYTRMATALGNSTGIGAPKKPVDVAMWLDKSNKVGFRPLHAAMKFQSLAVATLLLRDYRVSSAPRSSLQQTPLHVAALAGFSAGVMLLLGAVNAAADGVAAVDCYGYTPLALATRAQFADVVALLSGSSSAMHKQTIATIVKPTKFYYHPEVLRHLPMAYHRRGGDDPPPENPERIETLVDPVIGILRSREFAIDATGKESVRWDEQIPPADIANVLRVHEFHYVDKLRQHCEQLATPGASVCTSIDTDGVDAAESGRVFALDADTALSLRSYDAATRAAGAVCKAVDDVVYGVCDAAFCVVRPPGHHAGPVGKVVCANDMDGSHGFCLLNNVAIGAAYARSQYSRFGIHRVAIVDFDVHHGNGTEEIVRQLLPRTKTLRYATPYGEGQQIVQQYKPWRSADDAEHVFFASVHGYGHKDPAHARAHGFVGPDECDSDDGDDSSERQAAWFYPGSGESNVPDSDAAETVNETTATNENDEAAAAGPPHLYNVGLPFCRDGATAARLHWRSAFRDDVLPKLLAFKPDLIFLSSGFDAHRKEHMNWGYGALLEQDYEWLVRHVKAIAHTCCHGRVVSVLEGGYNFHARIVSPFARSVAAHARALADPSKATWDPHAVALEAAHDAALLATYSSTREQGGEGDETTPAGAGMSVSSKKKRGDHVAVSSCANERDDTSLAASRGKRARKDVDYVALAEELAAQQKK